MPGRGRRVSGGRGLLFGLLSLGLVVGPAAAATRVVDDDGTYDAAGAGCDGTDVSFTGIQAAITAAVDGDTAFVCPGTYNESLIQVTKALTVQGSGADVTIIDGGGGFGNSLFGTVRITTNTGNVLFDGFTVRNPRATTSATALRVGITVASSQPVTITVSNNVIVGTYAVDWRSTEVIDAELNWWGDASGPTVATNPSGTGGAIGASGGPVGAGVID